MTGGNASLAAGGGALSGALQASIAGSGARVKLRMDHLILKRPQQVVGPVSPRLRAPTNATETRGVQRVLRFMARLLGYE